MRELVMRLAPKDGRRIRVTTGKRECIAWWEAGKFKCWVSMDEHWNMIKLDEKKLKGWDTLDGCWHT